MSRKKSKKQAVATGADTPGSALEVALIQKALEPLIRQLIETREISLDTFGKEIAPLAAIKMASLLTSDKDDVALRASERIMDRELGKPVERRQILHADIKDLNPKQLDNEILRYLKKDPKLLEELKQLTLDTQPISVQGALVPAGEPKPRAGSVVQELSEDELG